MNFKLISNITEYYDLKNQLSVMKDNLHLFQDDEEFNLCYELIKSSLTFYKTKYEIQTVIENGDK